MLFSITTYHIAYTDSCKTAKCGDGKRCAIRNGQPKCICSPMCKAGHDKISRGNFPFTPASLNRNNNKNQRKHNKNSENGRVFVLSYDSWSAVKNRTSLEKRDVHHRHAKKRLMDMGGNYRDDEKEFRQNNMQAVCLSQEIQFSVHL